MDTKINLYIKKLDNANRSVDGLFGALLREGLSICDVSEKDLAHVFNTNRMVVWQWMSGISYPYTEMKEAVYDYFRQQIVKKGLGQVYTFCESAFAVSNYPWHIRPITALGKKTSGGIDTAGLCGTPNLKFGGWDVNPPITEFRLKKCACPKCVEIYRKLKQEGDM